ncbi:O-antigen polymerase [Rivularia sp. IAM M-261]|nr:O-antigen polymerase [Calothrix sp. PCC 7716]GJD17380.1 O-antigen polymerase [Rivularia sp. IAM M-261]
MTISSSKKTNNFLVYYQCFLAVVIVGVFFTAADIYWFDSGYTPPPYVLVLAVGLAATPLVPSFLSFNYKYFPNALLGWCIFYVVFSFLSYLLTIKNDLVNQELDDRILVVIFLCVSSFVFSGKDIVIKITRISIFCVIFWNIYTYIAELFQPEIWHTLTTFNPTGRPAGFYTDPNKAACVLINALIFTVGLLPPKYRLPFCLIVFLSVFTTFSRGGMICMIILITLFFIKKILPKQQLIFIFAGVLALILNFSILGEFLESEASNLGIINYDLQTRISTFTNPTSRQASDDTSRLDVVTYSWQKILESPLSGHGFGFVKTWGEILPHNMYLSYMLEHGIVGIIILPWLVFAVQSRANGEAKNLGLFLVVFTLIWSIFSNTVVYDRETLTIFSLMGVMSKKSQTKQLSVTFNYLN